MKHEEITELLSRCQAVIVSSHVVYTSGRHGSAYVNKDAINPHTVEVSRLCFGIAELFKDHGVETVVGPAVGAISLSQWTASHLTQLTGREVLALHVEREEKALFKADKESLKFTLSESRGGVEKIITLEVGEELVIKGISFGFKRGYAKLVAGKRTLVVEDVLTTGGSCRKTVEAVRTAGGIVVGAGVLCNRGQVTPEMLADVPELQALLNVTLDSWPEEECPLCKEGVPINTEVGKGKDFLARKATQQ